MTRRPPSTALREELAWAREVLDLHVVPDRTLARACRTILARSDRPLEKARAADMLCLVEAEV